MKLTDFLTDAGRPVAYFPKLKRLTGSTTATILLCQFIYWRGKEANEDGWLYKTSEQIEDETGLSYNEQKTARKTLVEAGLIQEHYARLDHEMRFLVNLDVINEKWGIADSQNGECDNSTFGKDGLSHSLNESENTAETTTEKVASSEKLSKEDLDFANKKVDVILALNKPGAGIWRGRENFRDNHLIYADWWHETTNQTCGKRQQRSWQKAFSTWQDEGLDIASLKESYTQDISWKKIIADPNEITKKAIAIKAMQGKAPSQSKPPAVDENDIPITY